MTFLVILHENSLLRFSKKSYFDNEHNCHLQNFSRYKMSALKVKLVFRKNFYKRPFKEDEIQKNDSYYRSNEQLKNEANNGV